MSILAEIGQVRSLAGLATSLASRVGGGIVKGFHALRKSAHSQGEHAFQSFLNTFATLDANGDGIINGADAATGQVKGLTSTVSPVQAFINTMDRDGSGTLSQTEFQGTKQVFRIFDLNGDGELTAGEMMQSLSRLQTEKNTQEFVIGLIKAADSNGDGVLTAGEMGISPDTMNRIDLDSDGLLTRDELIKAYGLTAPPAGSTVSIEA